ncbi:MAG: hypothetical protein IPP48_03110 [Chitinophagaceae bacterium]|nr:hypothetical protein [Chitinophagaceae bacterium]
MIKDLYRNFLIQLQGIYSLSEATNITDWVFEHTAHVKKTDIVKTPTLQVSESVRQKLHNNLTQLLAQTCAVCVTSGMVLQFKF